MYGGNTNYHGNPYIQGTTVPCDDDSQHMVFLGYHVMYMYMYMLFILCIKTGWCARQVMHAYSLLSKFMQSLIFLLF